MADLDLIGEARIEVSTSGVAEANAGLDRLGAGVDGLVVKQDKLTAAQIRVNAQLEATAKKYDIEYRAITELSKAQDLLDRAKQQGLSSSEAYARISDSVTVKLQAQAEAARVANAEQQRLAATMRQASQASINTVTGVRTDFDTAARAADIAAYGAELDRVRAKYDPLFAAGQKYRNGLVDLQQALSTGAISEAAYTIELGRRKDVFAEQVRGLGNLSKAERDAAAAAREATEATAVQAAAMTKTQTQWAALSGQGTAQGTAFAANEKLAGQFRAFSAQGTAQARALGVIEAAQVSNTKATALHAAAWQNLGYQTNDVLTSLASGASPFMVLAQQGGQIYQVLAGAQGGVVGALGAIKDRVLAISPLVGVFGAAAAGLTLAAVAAYRFVAAQRDIQLALLGAGQGAGVTADQVQSIAEKAARTTDITVSGAREIEKAFLQTGRVFGEVFLQGITAAENFGKATGQDRTKAAEFLGNSLANLGGGGYEDLAKRAGNFDAVLEDQVRSLLASGKEMEAQRLVVERFGQAYDTTKEKLTGLQRGLASADQYVKNLAESFGKAIASVGAPTGLEKQLQNAEAAIKVRASLGLDSTEQEASKARIIADLKQVSDASQKATDTVRRNTDAAAKGAITALIPEVASLEKIRQQGAEANKVLNALENTPGSDPQRIEAAKKAVAGAAAAERDYAAAGGPANMERAKANETLKAGLQALQARTPEEKAAAARQQELASSFGTTSGATERSARAADAYNKSLAESRQASVDQSRTMGEGTKTANALADATAKTGKSVEYLTAQRKVDEQIAAAGTIDKAERETKIREQLQSQLGALNQQTAERIRSAKDQGDVQQSLNDKVAAGTMVSAEAQRRMATETEISKLVREADAAQGDQKAILTQRVNELRAATEAQISAEQRTQVLSLTEDENRRIAVLQRESELLGETTEKRNRELAVLQAKQNLERQGISTTAPESKGYIDRAAFRSDIETAKQQYERLAQDISSAVSGIFDDMFKAGNKGMSGLLDSFSRGFQDRSFASQTDTTTVAGSLATFDRKADQERQAEALAGGQAMVDLEQALAGERLGIGRDFATKAAAEAQATADAITQRRQGYGDRAFTAGNDGSTEVGALAAFDRQAQQQRAQEAQSGGQAIAELEQALAAERLGIVRDFATRAAEAAKAAEEALASRVEGYGDRQFAASNDNTALPGRLVAYDRQAQREREIEVKAGGQALVQLEAAQVAERARIVMDANAQAAAAAQQAADAALATQRQNQAAAYQSALQAVQTAQQDLTAAYQQQTGALDTTISRLQAFSKSIREFRDGLKLNAALSPLSPEERLLEAQRQFRATAALASTGDEAAQGQLQGASQAYLDEAKSFYASSERYYAAFGEVQDTLDRSGKAADDQAADAQKQLAALQQQVGILININTGVKSVADAVAALKLAMLVADNTRDFGQNPAQNRAITAQLGAAGINYAGQFGNGEFQTYLAQLPQGQQQAANAIVSQNAGMARNFGAYPQRNQSITRDLRALGIFYEGDFGAGKFAAWENNLAPGVRSTVDSVVARYANVMMRDGGLVGNGRFDVDSVLARYAGGGYIGLAGGEFVMPAQQAQANLPMLEGMRSGAFQPANGNGNGITQAQFEAGLQKLALTLAAAISSQTQALRSEFAEDRGETRKAATSDRIAAQKSSASKAA